MSREKIDFTDINMHNTAYTGSGLNAASTGKAVTVVAPATTGLGTSGDVLLGGVTQFEADGYASIQDQGYIKLPCATKLSVGTNVTVDGSGNVIAGSEKARPFVVDNTDWATDGKLVILL